MRAEVTTLQRAADPKSRPLDHIPGEEGWPIIGNTFELLADPLRFAQRMGAAYGPVYRARTFGETSVTLLGPDANEFVLLDPQKRFSSEQGWGPQLERLFPRGLMLLDFDEHRIHRRALSVAFKAGPMRSYFEQLNYGIAASIAKWPRGRMMLFYPAMKDLTLDLAATSFLGTDLGPDREALKTAFAAMTVASIAPIRVALPGTKMRRGVKGRQFLTDYFTRQISVRRESGGDDLFSHLCRATYEDGTLLSPDDIANHMNFFMLAAHDTLTSSLTALVHRLAAHPEWQSAVRDELAARDSGGGSLCYDDLEQLPLTEMAFKEALRMTPPLAMIPRRTNRDCEFNGFKIPAQTMVRLRPLHTHFMADIWPEPQRYDPTRFSEAASRGRHRFAFVPFGGGAHMCLGLNFAYMQAKCFAWHFMRKFRVSLESGYEPSWDMAAIPKPRDGLRVSLSAA